MKKTAIYSVSCTVGIDLHKEFDDSISMRENNNTVLRYLGSVSMQQSVINNSLCVGDFIDD